MKNDILWNDVDKNIFALKAGIFMSYISHPFKNLTTTIGLRGDYFGYTKKSHLSPRFSSSYEMNERLTLNAAIGLFYQNLPLLILSQDRDKMIPPQYYDDGISIDDLINTLQQQIIKEPGYRVEKASQIHLKLLAARSGLGKYGRNNIIFVDGMGSFITLYAFFTDFQFDEDNWHELKMLEECEKCRNCLGICPTSCITMKNFVIDVTKCITLYNEIDGKFPRWIRRRWHNALMGCMKCQIPCPANEKVPDYAGRLEDVTEKETRKILQGESDDELINSLTKKLKGFAPATSKEYFPIFTRNLSVLIRQNG